MFVLLGLSHDFNRVLDVRSLRWRLCMMVVGKTKGLTKIRLWKINDAPQAFLDHVARRNLQRMDVTGVVTLLGSGGFQMVQVDLIAVFTGL